MAQTMAHYKVFTWAEDDPQGLNEEVACFSTYDKAREYVEAHAWDFYNGLYILRPDGLVDDGVDLIDPQGRIVGPAPGVAPRAKYEEE